MSSRPSKFIKRYCLPLLLTLLPTLVSCGSDSNNGQNDLSHLQVSGRWTPLPVPIYVSEEISQNRKMLQDVYAATAYWEYAAGKKLFDLNFNWDGPVPPFSGTYDSPSQVLANLLFFVDPWPLDHNIKGQTILVIKGEQFQNALIYLNREDYCIGACMKDRTRISFRRLLAHEFGHVLGLRHTTDANDIMYPNIPLGRPLAAASYSPDLLQLVIR